MSYSNMGIQIGPFKYFNAILPQSTQTHFVAKIMPSSGCSDLGLNPSVHTLPIIIDQSGVVCFQNNMV